MSIVNASGRAASPTAPADRLVAIVPNDAADLPHGICRGVYVGGAGNVVLLDAAGGQTVLPSAAFQYHPVRVSRVLASGTTATEIIALY